MTLKREKERLHMTGQSLSRLVRAISIVYRKTHGDVGMDGVCGDGAVACMTASLVRAPSGGLLCVSGYTRVERGCWLNY